MALPRRARPRIEALVARFPDFLGVFTADPAFTRSGQLKHHIETIRRRRTLGSVRAALADTEFLNDLYLTLQAWGIGSRASNLKSFEEFGAALKSKSIELAELEPLRVDDPNLDIASSGDRIWRSIESLGIVSNDTSIVSGSKALHHILPELIVPFDRKYTQEFFGWHNPQVQYRERQCFLDAFAAFVEIARRVNPEQYRDAGWNSSRTKVLDNAVVGFVRNPPMADAAPQEKRPDLMLRPNETCKTANFESYSCLAQELAKNKPTLWEYRLTAELLRTRIGPVLGRWHDLEANGYARPAQEVPVAQIGTWIRNRVDDLQQMTGTWSRLVNSEIKSSWGPPGQAGDDQQIRRVCEELTDCAQRLLGWEESIRFAEVPTGFEDVQGLLAGLAGRVLEQTARMSEEMSRIFTQGNPAGNYQLSLVIDLPADWDKKFKTATERAMRSL